MVLSGAEVRQAARFQTRFTDAHSGRSPFFTLVFQMNAEQQVEPFAFQVSDMCVALERDGVLTDCADIGFLAVREAKKGEFLPGIMYKDKLMNANEPFLPDDFIVKAVVSEPKVVTPMFRHAKFPFVGNSAAVAAHFTALSREEWHQKLSDFNLLVHLPAVIGLPRTLAVCEAVKAKRALTAPERVELEKALRAASVQF